MNSIIKFTIIIFCFLITVLCKKPLNKLDLQLLRLGMFFTVLADLFLVILDYNTIGVALFCMVQLIYIVRYDVRHFDKIAKVLFIVFIIMFSFYIYLYNFVEKFDFIMFIALFYSICISISLYKSIIYPHPNKQLIVWGMVLFSLCDINVALSYFGIMKELSLTLIWIFYIPSQFLLSISGYEFSAARERP